MIGRPVTLVNDCILIGLGWVLERLRGVWAAMNIRDVRFRHHVMMRRCRERSLSSYSDVYGPFSDGAVVVSVQWCNSYLSEPYVVAREEGTTFLYEFLNHSRQMTCVC